MSSFGKQVGRVPRSRVPNRRASMAPNLSGPSLSPKGVDRGLRDKENKDVVVTADGVGMGRSTNIPRPQVPIAFGKKTTKPTAKLAPKERNGKAPSSGTDSIPRSRSVLGERRRPEVGGRETLEQRRNANKASAAKGEDGSVALKLQLAQRDATISALQQELEALKGMRESSNDVKKDEDSNAVLELRHLVRRLEASGLDAVDLKPLDPIETDALQAEAGPEEISRKLDESLTSMEEAAKRQLDRTEKLLSSVAAIIDELKGMP